MEGLLCGGSGNRKDAEFAAAMDRGFRSAGWRGALNEGFKARIRQRRPGYASAFEIASLYADLGDKDKAFEWLNMAYREHDFPLKKLNTVFEVDNLRTDPRLTELVRKVGLPHLK
jgi:hypothetical protein